jgi:hypothetical protein
MTVSLLPARLQKSILADLEGFFALKGEPLLLKVPARIPQQTDYIDNIGWDTNAVEQGTNYELQAIFTTADQAKGWSSQKAVLNRLPLGWIETADAIVEIRQADLDCFHLTLNTTMTIKRNNETYRIDHVETYRNLVIAIVSRLTTV